MILLVCLAPGNVGGTNTSKDDNVCFYINVTWTEPDECDQNGEIISYTVKYESDGSQVNYCDTRTSAAAHWKPTELMRFYVLSGWRKYVCGN